LNLELVTGLETRVPPVMSVGTLASIVGSLTSEPQALANVSPPALSLRKDTGWALTNSW